MNEKKEILILVKSQFLIKISRVLDLYFQRMQNLRKKLDYKCQMWSIYNITWKHISALCAKAKPQVSEIEILKGTAKPEGEAHKFLFFHSLSFIFHSFFPYNLLTYFSLWKLNKKFKFKF